MASKFCKKNGFFIEFIDVDPIKRVIYIEQNFGSRVLKLPKYIYHLTPFENVKKILSNGLIPKTMKKIEPHPKRIYCLLTLKKYEVFEKTLLKYTITNYDKLALLEIDTTKIKNKFYRDNDLLEGIYTDERISPNAIEHLNNSGFYS